MIIGRMFARMQRLLARYPGEGHVVELLAEIASTRVPAVVSTENVVAIQCVEDPFYLGLFSAISQRLKLAYGTSTDLVVIRSLINGTIGRGFLHRWLHSAIIGSLISRQWIRAFRSAADGVAYRELSPLEPLRGAFDWVRSFLIWKRAKRSADFSALQILDLPVGDLIIDSYLRFRPSPRFDVRDSFVLLLIWQVHRSIRKARAYFRHTKPKIYLTSYSTYIDHGIPVRVALQEGVQVTSFGSFAEFGKDLSFSDWFHTPDATNYRSAFEGLENQDVRLAQAEQQLAVRLAGGVDAATSYMKVSAYATDSEPVPDMRGSVVVFLHDFYDSAHAYDDLLFEDFWKWTCFTIDTLQAADRRFFVKPHPNQVHLSSLVLNELRLKYPGLAILSAKVSNAQLAAAGMVCGVTVYGTVAHELAYFGIATIGSAKHPHHSFDFCRTAHSFDEYARFLRTAAVLPASREELRRQALAFYYMRNLFGDIGLLSLRSQYVAFWRVCSGADGSTMSIAQSFRSLRDSPEFRSRVEKLIGFGDRNSSPAYGTQGREAVT